MGHNNLNLTPCDLCGDVRAYPDTVVVRSASHPRLLCGSCWTGELVRRRWSEPKLLDLDRVCVCIGNGHWRPFHVRYYPKLQVLVAFQGAKSPRVSLSIAPWMGPALAVSRLLRRLERGDASEETSGAGEAALVAARH